MRMTTGVLAAGVLAIAMTGCLPTLPVGQPPSDPVQTPPPPTTPPPSPDTTPSDPPPPTPSTSAPPAGEGPDVGAGATVEELFVGQFDPVTIDDGAGDIWTISPTGVYVITTEESLAQDTAVYALEIQATHDDGGTSFAPTCFTISLDESGTLFEVPTNESDLPNTVVEQREDIVDGYAYVAGPVGLDAATWVFESNYGDETHTFEFQP